MSTQPFGRHMLEHWCLDPAIVYLNHGTVGVPPRRVLQAQQRLRDEMERQPSRFLLRELSAIVVGSGPLPKPRIRAAADAVAGFLGARGDDLVFVDNATAGVNAVLRSLDLRPGDEILLLEGCYGAVLNTARYVARERGGTFRTVALPEPLPERGAVAGLIASDVGPRTRVVVMDHIMSESALLLPLSEIAAACRARGASVLVDGAHAPGAIPLDIPSLGVDWYTGNLHKWAQAPHTSGILWAAPERQPGLHPVVISWGLDQGFTTEFDLVGTRDPTAHLAAPEGLAFMRDLGVEEMQAYNHALAWESARLLSSRLGTPIGRDESWVGTMVTIPLPDRAGSTVEEAGRLRDALLFEDRIEVQLHAARGRLWVRVCAQVYNDIRDVERLADALAARL
ncbi:MAG TPA: aminotransferase class V-fold PLP-dependent enzyme [Vicinamibacterales bacterium]|nr:aminotransferase class V-fold PLP-dependent enzyme [Vicinamibacterales bacterium]